MNELRRATGLDRLRRTARILMGNPLDGDRLLRSVPTIDLESFRHAVAFSTRVPDALVALAQAMPDYMQAREGVRDLPTLEDGTLGFLPFREQVAGDLGKLTGLERKAFALLDIEELDPRSAAVSAAWPTHVLESALQRAREQLFGSFRTILFIERDTEIRIALRRWLQTENVDVRAVATVDEAVMELASSGFDLILSEPFPANSSEGRSLVQQAGENGTSISWMTAFTGRDLLNEDPGPSIINHPRWLEQVKAQLYIEPHKWFSPIETFIGSDIIEDFKDGSLEPASAPIDVEVIDNALRLAPSVKPAAAVSFEALDFVRAQHAREAVAIADQVRATNGSPRVLRRLDAVAALLAQALTENTVIGVAVATDALARLLPLIEEEFTALAAGDMAAFTEDLQRFANQFPISRQFNAEASADRPITAAEEAALQSVVNVLLDQPDELVTPDLKKQLRLIAHVRATLAGSKVSDVAWVRSVSNAVKAVGRYFRDLGRDFHNETRAVAIRGVGQLGVTLVMTESLQYLGMTFPMAFAGAVIVLKGAKAKLDEKGKSADDDEGDD